jgi:hypothetical protein
MSMVITISPDQIATTLLLANKEGGLLVNEEISKGENYFQSPINP